MMRSRLKLKLEVMETDRDTEVEVEYRCSEWDGGRSWRKGVRVMIPEWHGMSWAG